MSEASKPRYEIRLRRHLLGEDGEDAPRVSSDDREYIFYTLGKYMSQLLDTFGYYAVYDNEEKEYTIRVAVLKRDS